VNFYKFLKKRLKFFYWVFLLFIFYKLFIESEVFYPKPYGYREIDIPNAEYVLFSQKNFPYKFLVSKFSKVNIIEDKNTTYCIDINYPNFNACLEITYKNFENILDLKKYLEISENLAFFHKVKSYKITKKLIQKEGRDPFVLIKIFGETPTKIQFYVTDKKKNFLRGALYFESCMDDEYLKPVLDFIEKDIEKIIESIEWIK
jgi:gliding motility-associated lipoprotein GldD